MPHQLSQRERFILLALMVHEPPTDVTNTSLKANFGLEIGPKERKNLDEAGYMKSLRGLGPGRPFLYELSAAGRKRAAEELAGSADPKSAINPRVVYALFNAVHRFLQRNHVPAEAVFNAGHHDVESDLDSPVGDAVTKEYGNLVEEPGAWVPLRALRDALSGIDRGELDDALKLLYSRRVIRLTSEANRRTLSEADKAAALSIGGDDVHWMAIV